MFFSEVVMDRSWMKANRVSAEFTKGMNEFFQYACEKLPNNNGKLRCPCVNCLNRLPQLLISEIRNHLVCDGICETYTNWIWHGEPAKDMPNVSEREVVDVDMDNQLEDMIRDIGPESFQRDVYDALCSDNKEPLYPGCTNFTRLYGVLRLFNLKARNGWTDKSFTEL